MASAFLSRVIRQNWDGRGGGGGGGSRAGWRKSNYSSTTVVVARVPIHDARARARRLDTLTTTTRDFRPITGRRDASGGRR